MGDIPVDFFVSYTSADRPWAEWIAWELEDAGFSVIVQAWDMQPGSNFVLQMDDAARVAARTVAVLSPAFGHVFVPDALRADPTWVEGQARHWALANPQHQHGPHRYDLERFGLTDAAVDAAFTPYLERFGALVDA